MELEPHMISRINADTPENWMAEGPVLLGYHQHVATLTLNRPDALAP
jgi:hypothetical protein